MLKILILTALATINCISYAYPEHSSFPPEHPSDHPEHPSDHPEQPSEENATDENAEKQAKALLSEVHNVYKKADGVTETLTITIPNPMGESQTMKISIVIGDSSGSITAEQQGTFVWADGKVFASLSEVPGGYVKGDAPDGFCAGLKAISDGQLGIPSWSLSLRESDNYDAWLESLNIFGLPSMTISGVESKEVDGENVEVLSLSSPAGRVEVTVNDDKQIESLVGYLVQPGMPEFVIPIVAETSFAKVTNPATFEVGDRKEYDSLEEMLIASMPAGPGGPDGEASTLTGNTAPDFTLDRMDGSGEVTLSKLKGQVVVLDFWATWCGPCKRGLPGLNEFDKWTQEEDLPVQIFAVNVWEEGQDEKVKKFWADNKYETKVLMGSEDKKLTENYQISGIPLTVVIGPDGNIFELHSGYTPDMDAKLKKSVMSALGATDEPEHPDHPN